MSVSISLEVIIGLEIHAQMNTATKLFCSCSNDSFGKEANINVCPVCLGHPGQLPVLNEACLHKGMEAGLALGCTIQTLSTFDRKQYFYPDLSKGYQITQFDQPIAVDGCVEYIHNEEEKKVRIRRMHLEDDAGKLVHVGTESWCDYNRAGAPLMEIVTEPDLRTPQDAKLFAEEVQKILRFVGASHCDMEKGMMRFDASLSLRPIGATPEEYPEYPLDPINGVLFPRIEIKNLNSFRSLEAALEYEITRQTQLWEEGSRPTGEMTVGWIDDEKRTKTLRDKESSADYRYFPEPDVPPVLLTQEEIDAIRLTLPVMPAVRRKKYHEEYELSAGDALFLSSTKELSDFYEETVRLSGDPKSSSNWILSVLMSLVKEAGMEIETQKVTPQDLSDIMALVKSSEISSKIAKDVLNIVFETGEKPRDIIIQKGWKQVSDTSVIEDLVSQVIAENPQSVVDFQAGKDKALAALIGQVMKLTKGQANPQIVNDILRKHLTS